MYASTLPRSNWLRRASIRLAWYRHMPASSFCLYGWEYLNAGWCHRREILAQGRANTRDGNEVVRGWSVHGAGVLNFYIEVNGEILRNPYLGNDTKFSAFGVARSRGYSFSWIRQLPFVFFAWASSNVVQYLGDRLAHVLMQNFSNRPRGFYTVAPKIRKFILFWQFLEFTSLYLRSDRESRHTMNTITGTIFVFFFAIRSFVSDIWAKREQNADQRQKLTV